MPGRCCDGAPPSPPAPQPLLAHVPWKAAPRAGLLEISDTQPQTEFPGRPCPVPGGLESSHLAPLRPREGRWEMGPGRPQVTCHLWRGSDTHRGPSGRTVWGHQRTRQLRRAWPGSCHRSGHTLLAFLQPLVGEGTWPSYLGPGPSSHSPSVWGNPSSCVKRAERPEPSVPPHSPSPAPCAPTPDGLFGTLCLVSFFSAPTLVPRVSVGAPDPVQQARPHGRPARPTPGDRAWSRGCWGLQPNLFGIAIPPAAQGHP